ncbi:ribonuclease H [Brucella pseudogrignonensis]|uniref:ribonuclease H family protein n=1 Tax=Brucella pseudogrignonensis TaxID=419475 RepID=UPI0028B5EACC|nr:ribonuclease H [Brucella pseudogrignonensis]MDT6940713.1 ribonuclease H [Brucella pseudogrignonensis]
MTYEWPESLYTLRDWLKQNGLSSASLKTERQAAFMAQQLLGTRHKFPEKGASCFPLLKAIQDTLPEDGKSIIPKAKTSQAVKSSGKGSKRADGADINLPAAGLIVFSDGGCDPNPGAGGWGMAVYRDGVEVHSDCGGMLESTNNVMELTGMLNAIRWAASQSEPVHILCDSQYVVNGCNDWRHGWKKHGWKRGKKELANADLWQEIDAALNGADQITIAWVKGHAGVEGNERADELATMGREIARGKTEPSMIEQQLQYVV